jgi:DNA-binding transcriptional LysR family regulator
MDLKQLAALVTVAEVGSVTKAAALLHLVQPAVTRQIRTLEEEFGVPFFERTRQGMIPTAAGTLMVERARRALQELDRARSEIQPKVGGLSGTVTVGLLESVIEVLLEPLAEVVRARHPGIRLRVVTAYSGHLQQWLDEGSIDLSLLYDTAGTSSLSVLPLLEEGIWAVGGPDAGLRVDRPLTWEALLEQPLAMPISGHGLRTLIERSRPPNWSEPQIAFETNSMHMQKQLVLRGLAWTILPAVGVANEVARRQLTAAPLLEPELARSLVLAQQRRGRPARSVQVVAQELLGLIKSLLMDGAWPSARLSPSLARSSAGAEPA